MNAGMPVRLFLELTGFGLPLHYSKCPKSGSVPGTPLKPHTHTYKHTPLHTHTHTHTHRAQARSTQKIHPIYIFYIDLKSVIQQR